MFFGSIPKTCDLATMGQILSLYAFECQSITLSTLLLSRSAIFSISSNNSKASCITYLSIHTQAAWDWSVPASIMLTCEECRAQQVKASFTVDCHSYAIAEDLWVTQARLAHTILHMTRVRTVYHWRKEKETLLETIQIVIMDRNHSPLCLGGNVSHIHRQRMY